VNIQILKGQKMVPEAGLVLLGGIEPA